MTKRVSARVAEGVEYRALTGDSAVSDGKITGLAAPFGSQTMIGEAPWGFREQIAPGAFSKTLNEADVVFLVNHNTDMPLARTSAGTLSLRQTPRGLEYEAQPANTTYANDLIENIRSGNIQGNSFGFMVTKDDWQVGEDGVDERTIREVKLLEVSACTFPAYGDTDVSMRDAAAAARERRAAKYTSAQLQEMLAKGEAFKNANDEPSYPIADADDLSNAIHAVGRGGADHNAIRKYIIGRAKALGLSSQIPDNWNADGSISEQNSAPPVTVSGTDYTDMASALISMYNALPEDVRAVVLSRIESRDKADGDDTEDAKSNASPDHGPVTGTHSHAHSAFGSQGGDSSHAHSHTHAGDASHDHHGSEQNSQDPPKPDDSTSETRKVDRALMHDLLSRKPLD